MQTKGKKLLSVVIPCYQQEKTIIKDLKRIFQALVKIRYSWEIVIVIDGKVDNTYQKVKKISSSKIKIYKLPQNLGKGYAVRYGMKRAKGNYVAFLDAGMKIDPSGLSTVLEHLEWYKADIVVGSKRHPASEVDYPLERKILSLVFYWLVRFLFGFKVKDTQAGIKIFRKKVLEKVLPVLLVKGYAFDIEILSVAHRFGFERIYEAPIKVKYQSKNYTNAANLKNILVMLWDTVAIFYRLKILRYYDLPPCHNTQKNHY